MRHCTPTRSRVGKERGGGGRGGGGGAVGQTISANTMDAPSSQARRASEAYRTQMRQVHFLGRAGSEKSPASHPRLGLSVGAGAPLPRLPLQAALGLRIAPASRQIMGYELLTARLTVS